MVLALYVLKNRSITVVVGLNKEISFAIVGFSLLCNIFVMFTDLDEFT